MICRFKALDAYDCDCDIEGADALVNDAPPPTLEEVAADGFLASVEFVEAGCPTPDPPEAPAFPLAA